MDFLKTNNLSPLSQRSDIIASHYSLATVCKTNTPSIPGYKLQGGPLQAQGTWHKVGIRKPATLDWPRPRTPAQQSPG